MGKIISFIIGFVILFTPSQARHYPCYSDNDCGERRPYCYANSEGEKTCHRDPQHFHGEGDENEDPHSLRKRGLKTERRFFGGWGYRDHSHHHNKKRECWTNQDCERSKPYCYKGSKHNHRTCHKNPKSCKGEWQCPRGFDCYRKDWDRKKRCYREPRRHKHTHDHAHNHAHSDFRISVR